MTPKALSASRGALIAPSNRFGTEVELPVHTVLTNGLHIPPSIEPSPACVPGSGGCPTVGLDRRRRLREVTCRPS